MINKLNDKFYTDIYSQQTEDKSDFRQMEYLYQRIRSVLKNPKTILDVGCGIGTFGVIIKNHLHSNVSGLDINKKAVDTARKRGIKASISDIEGKWPIKNNQFELVSLVQVIEHVMNPDHLLQEANRVLKNNGYLVIATPNLAAWYNRILLPLGFQPFLTEVSTLDKTLGMKFIRKLTSNRQPLGHLRVFTLRGLKDLLEHHGYKIILIKGGKQSYFPRLMQGIDWLMSFYPALSTDLIIVAQKIRVK